MPASALPPFDLPQPPMESNYPQETRVRLSKGDDHYTKQTALSEQELSELRHAWATMSHVQGAWHSRLYW